MSASASPPNEPHSDAQPPEAWLYLERGRAVHRVRLSALTTLGSSPDAHLTLPGRGVQAIHAEIRWSHGAFRLVPNATSPIWVSDRPAASAVPLAHADRIRIGDCTLLFVRPPADNKTAHKTYIVVRRADGFVFHWAAQHARIWVGRTHGDLLVMDDRLAGRHFLVESWGPDAIYVFNERETAPVQLYGDALGRGSRRVWNGGVVSAGNTQFGLYGRPRGAAVQPPWLTDERRAARAGQAPTPTPAPAPEAVPEPPSLHALRTQLLGASAVEAAISAASAGASRVEAAVRPAPVRSAPVRPAVVRPDDVDTRETALDAILEVARDPARPSNPEGETSQVSLAAIEDAMRDAGAAPEALRASRAPVDLPRAPTPRSPVDPVTARRQLAETAYVPALDSHAPGALPRLTIQMERPSDEQWRPPPAPGTPADPSAQPDTPPRVVSRYLHGEPGAGLGAGLERGRSEKEGDRYAPRPGKGKSPTSTSEMRARQRDDDRYRP